MAIISAGTLKRKKLIVPKGDVRPSQRHVRLSIFDFLADFVRNAEILDLFAGTGAFGIEAISRGASKITFVDISSKATQAIKENLETLNLKNRSRVFREDSLEFAVKLARRAETFDIIFIDPPFNKLRAMQPDEYEDYVLEILDRSSKLLNNQAIVIFKYPKKLPIKLPSSLQLMEEKTYGINRVAFLGQKEYIIQKETAHDSGSQI